MTAKRGLLGLAIVGLALWFAGGPSDCKQAAQPLIDALERYHQINGQYPDTLDELVQVNLLRALPHPTWNLGVRHMDDFEYWVEHDLDYYCLAYAEAPIFDGIGPPHWDEVSYVSFRRGWDDSATIPQCDLSLLPVQRAGERFRESRSSADLRLLVKKVIGSVSQGRSIYWDDVAVAIGSGSQCAIEGHAGLCVEAGDNEATAFFFITRRAHTLRGKSDLLIRILERHRNDNAPRWREVLHDQNEWEWLGRRPTSLSPAAAASGAARPVILAQVASTDPNRGAQDGHPSGSWYRGRLGPVPAPDQVGQLVSRGDRFRPPEPRSLLRAGQGDSVQRTHTKDIVTGGGDCVIEDESRTRERTLGTNLSWLRRLAVTLLKRHPDKDSLRGTMMSCIVNPDYLARGLSLQRV